MISGSDFIRKLVLEEDPFMYQVISGGILYTGTMFDDFTKTDLPAFIDVSELLRRKLYGLLLEHKRHELDTDTTHPTVMKLDYDIPYKLCNIYAVFPTCKCITVLLLMIQTKFFILFFFKFLQSTFPSLMK